LPGEDFALYLVGALVSSSEPPQRNCTSTSLAASLKSGTNPSSSFIEYLNVRVATLGAAAVAADPGHAYRPDPLFVLLLVRRVPTLPGEEEYFSQPFLA